MAWTSETASRSRWRPPTSSAASSTSSGGSRSHALRDGDTRRGVDSRPPFEPNMSRAKSEDRAVRIDAENESAGGGARRLSLTPRAFAVLRHLVEQRGRLMTKQELLTSIWGHAVVSDAALSSCIRDLRRALGDSSGTPRYIETVHRRGFRFIGPLVRPSVVSISRAVSTLVGRD